MKCNFLGSLVGAIACLISVAPAKAEPVYGVKEVRAGIFKHDLDLIASSHERGIALNGELRFVSPSWLDWAFKPQPTVGIVFPLSSYSTKHGYAGLTWIYEGFSPFFVEFMFGLAVHDGNHNQDFKPWKYQTPPRLVNERHMRKYLGSRVLFREAIEIGYRFGQGQQHSVSVLLSHLSHGQILSDDGRNGGMDHLGVRYGYRF